MKPAHLLQGAIVVQAALGLALGLPGHLSADSVVQLYEARTLQFISFQPPMMALLLRMLDAWVPGTALFVVLDQALLTASLALVVAWPAAQLRWPAAAAATLAVLNPVLLAYTGIVWKDVLLAHLAGFGYACLVNTARRDGASRTAWALVAVLALALAASARQHSLILAIPGAVYAAVLLVNGMAARLALAMLLSGVVLGVNVGIVAYADAVNVGPNIARLDAGMRSLVLFDLAGIAANGGVIPDPAIAAEVAATQAPAYTPLRNDPLPVLAPGSSLLALAPAELRALWIRTIANAPGPYLAHRTRHYVALLWPARDAALCVPSHAGVVASVPINSIGRDMVAALGLAGRMDARDRELLARAHEWRNTPLFTNAFWALMLAGAGIVLWRRRMGGALVVYAASALVFALGFAVIGISCEFRYLYPLPVAVTLLVVALLTDRAPPRAAASDA